MRKNEEIKETKRRKINWKGVKTKIIWALFITLLVLIYLVSPKITNSIQSFALWIVNLDPTYITRFVEMVLGVSLPTAVILAPFKKDKN